MDDHPAAVLLLEDERVTRYRFQGLILRVDEVKMIISCVHCHVIEQLDGVIVIERNR